MGTQSIFACQSNENVYLRQNSKFSQLLFAAFFSLNNGLFQKKIHTPTTEGTGGGGGGGLMALEIQTGRGSESKNTSSGVTFNFTDVSIASINKFSKIALRFLILLFFQTTDLLPHLF